MGGMFGGSSNKAQVAEQRRQEEDARRREAERQARIDAGVVDINDIFGGLGDDFFGGIRDAYTGYYQPQVQEQYDKAQEQLTYGLARRGTADSTIAGDEFADLTKQYNERTGEIRTAADAEMQKLRERSESERTAALNNLYATEDPDVAASIATNAVRNIQNYTPDYSPLGNLFNVAGGALERLGYGAEAGVYDRGRASVRDPRSSYRYIA